MLWKSCCLVGTAALQAAGHARGKADEIRSGAAEAGGMGMGEDLSDNYHGLEVAGAQRKKARVRGMVEGHLEADSEH